MTTAVHTQPKLHDDLTDASIVQSSSETTLTFTRPVTEDGEVVVEEGKASQIIYAFGNGNQLGYHVARGAAQVTFDNICGEPVQPPAELD